MGLVIRSRKSWGAEPPRNTPTRVSWKGKTLFVHHDAVGFQYRSTTRSGRLAEERAHMRNLQQIAFARGFSDISYNYVVFPTGRVYAGRGALVKGAHTQGGKKGYAAFYNDHPGVVFPGNYHTERKLTTRQVAAFAALRWALRSRYAVSRRVWPHRRVHATVCPGDNVVSRLGLRDQ